MKISQILKLAVIPVVTAFSILGISNIALADYLTSQGIGGDYRYELWSTDDNKNYYLKIWLRNANPKSSPYRVTRYFNSTRDALIYFDCYYAERSLPQCPK